MSNIINYNELRKLAAKAGKTRPILSCIMIKDGKAYYTDSRYLVVMEGYKNTDDCVMYIDNYKKCELGYLNLGLIIDRHYEPIKFEKVILNDKVVYKSDGIYIDGEILNQIKKLVNIKNFVVEVDKIKCSGSNLKLELPDESFIIFAPKYYWDK